MGKSTIFIDKHDWSKCSGIHTSSRSARVWWIYINSRKKIIYIHVQIIDDWVHTPYTPWKGRKRRKMMWKPAVNGAFIVGHMTWQAAIYSWSVLSMGNIFVDFNTITIIYAANAVVDFYCCNFMENGTSSDCIQMSRWNCSQTHMYINSTFNL